MATFNVASFDVRSPFKIGTARSVLMTGMGIATMIALSPSPGYACRVSLPDFTNPEGAVLLPLSPPMGENPEQWEPWKRWGQLETEPFMLGVSNVDYGGLMDMEYAAFGSVGDENNESKGTTFWYRVKRDRRVTDLGTYGTAEVVYFEGGEIKASMDVNILFDQLEVQGQR
ncbi:MAG: hypothetical protein AAGA67_12420 [Cyanobacteria bacterium P01_F01_bin.153]